VVYHRVVEKQRIEYKATWNKEISEAVMRSICAFANDLFNMNGGYIILGLEEENGGPVLPPRGLDDLDIDRIQREITGECKRSIFPEYLPMMFPEILDGKTILVLWVPAGDTKPYQAPGRTGSRTFWIRSGSSTIEATGDLLRQLMEQAAKTPFDDRRSLEGRIDDISPGLVRRFLADVGSGLADADIDNREVYRKLRLVVPVNGEVPRNVALMFFNNDPERFFRYARIEVVQFRDERGGDLLDERDFSGSLPDQIASCLKYLKGICGVLIRKVPDQAEAEHIFPYPYGAMEEGIVNAVYHRSYEYPPEPVKVYLYPNRMEIISYPGPVAGVRLEHLQQGLISPAPARNRRIGEFLKDLHLAEARGTGIPKIQNKMQENGSPQAIFDFDEDRTYFRVILPISPRYLALQAGPNSQ